MQIFAESQKAQGLNCEALLFEMNVSASLHFCQFKIRFIKTLSEVPAKFEFPSFYVTLLLPLVEFHHHDHCLHVDFECEETDKEKRIAC